MFQGLIFPFNPEFLRQFFSFFSKQGFLTYVVWELTQRYKVGWVRIGVLNITGTCFLFVGWLVGWFRCFVVFFPQGPKHMSLDSNEKRHLCSTSCQHSVSHPPTHL
jgi:hypothetical protein